MRSNRVLYISVPDPPCSKHPLLYTRQACESALARYVTADMLLCSLLTNMKMNCLSALVASK